MIWGNLVCSARRQKITTTTDQLPLANTVHSTTKIQQLFIIPVRSRSAMNHLITINQATWNEQLIHHPLLHSSTCTNCIQPLPPYH